MNILDVVHFCPACKSDKHIACFSDGPGFCGCGAVFNLPLGSLTKAEIAIDEAWERNR